MIKRLDPIGDLRPIAIRADCIYYVDNLNRVFRKRKSDTQRTTRISESVHQWFFEQMAVVVPDENSLTELGYHFYSMFEQELKRLVNTKQSSGV